MASTWTILVVDDSPTVLATTADTLLQRGYRVLTAADGALALELAKRERPHLVVLDIILPKRNGYQVCRDLKNDPLTKHAKVILLSSKSNESDRYWGLRQGADSYMTKPFETEELIANVSRLLGQTGTPSPSTARA